MNCEEETSYMLGEAKKNSPLDTYESAKHESGICSGIRAAKKFIKHESKRYLVDTSSSFGFYMPVRALGEFASGMSGHEVLQARLTAAPTYLFFPRYYGKFREYWARYVWRADAKSSKLKKFGCDVSCSIVGGWPLYYVVLHNSDASSDEIYRALIYGLALNLATSRPYGFLLDKWRKLWKEKPVLDNEDKKRPSEPAEKGISPV